MATPGGYAGREGQGGVGDAESAGISTLGDQGSETAKCGPNLKCVRGSVGEGPAPSHQVPG